MAKAKRVNGNGPKDVSKKAPSSSRTSFSSVSHQGADEKSVDRKMAFYPGWEKLTP